MSDKKPIGFRRVHGRVIPIFDKQKGKTAAAVGAGVATAGYAVAKYPNPIKTVAMTAAKFGSRAARALPLPAKLAVAGAAVGASTQVKLQNEKGEPVKLKLPKGSGETIKRAALAGAGAATAVKFGQWAGGAQMRVAQALNLAKTAGSAHKGLPLFEAAGVVKQTEYLKAAKNIAKSREALIATGAVGGALLLHEAFKKSTTKKDPVAANVKAKVIGLAAPALVAAGFYKRLNPGLKGKELIKIAVEKAYKFKRG